MQPGGKAKYSVVMLFTPGTDLGDLKKAAVDALQKKWGADKAKWPQNLRTPFRKHEEREKDGKLPEGYEAGGIFVTATSNDRPGVVNQQVVKIIDPSEVYAGCYGRATVRAYTYDKGGNRGVAFGLQNFQKTDDGESLTGRLKPEDEFKPVEGAGETGGTSVNDIL